MKTFLKFLPLLIILTVIFLVVRYLSRSKVRECKACIEKMKEFMSQGDGEYSSQQYEFCSEIKDCRVLLDKTVEEMGGILGSA